MSAPWPPCPQTKLTLDPACTRKETQLTIEWPKIEAFAVS